MAAATTIAHLTDVHLGPIAGFRPRYWNLKRATGYINWRLNRRGIYLREVLDRLVADLKAQSPDHIVVTGDLTNIGLPQEIENARDWLASLGPPDRVSVIPGNHDIYASIGRDAGVRRWAAFMQSDAFGQAFAGGADFPYVRIVGRVALIGLNSALPQPPFNARGNVGDAQLQRLGAALERLKRDGLHRVVMIHHPPLPGLATRRHDLADAGAMAAVLARHGAELVLHGHNHRDMFNVVETTDVVVPIVGLGSASLGHPHKDEPLARYNLYRIDDSGIEMTGRGLTTPGGAIETLEQLRLVAADATTGISCKMS